MNHSCLSFGPADLGFPSHFRDWRPGQDRAIADSLSSEIRALQQMVPTGGGKSGVYITDSLLKAQKTVILTITKLLQDQLTSEFSHLGLVDIRGRQNYPCLLSREMGAKLTCADGSRMRCPHREAAEGRCPHKIQVSKAKAAPIVVTNYDTWIASQIHHADSTGKPDLLVLDECHAADDKLVEHLSVVIRPSDGQITGHPVPYSTSGARANDFLAWGAKVAPLVQIRCATNASRLVDQIKRGERPHSEDLKESRIWSNLQERLDTLTYLSKRSTNLICDPQIQAGFFQGTRVGPVWASPFAEDYLFCHIPRVRLCSATARPMMLDYLGLHQAESEHRDYPSSFPIRSSPIYYWPIAKMSRKNEDETLPLVVDAMDKILKVRPDRKGLVQGVSYDRSRDIHKLSRFKGRILIHKPGEAMKALEYFLESTEPLVLCSPVFTTGVDLKYDRCEMIFIPKLPFEPHTSALAQARDETDKFYGGHRMVQTLQQSVGRAMRTEHDHCETWIFDAWWKSARYRFRHLLTPWFLALQFAHDSRIPPAPEAFLGRRQYHPTFTKKELEDGN